jgi:hypothetical protein
MCLYSTPSIATGLLASSNVVCIRDVLDVCADLVFARYCHEHCISGAGSQVGIASITTILS